MQFIEIPTTPTVIVDAAAALPMPPTNYGVVPSWWVRADRIVAEFDLDIWCDASVSLTNAELVGAIPQPQTIADVVLTSVDHATDTLTKVAHGLKTGDGPLQLTTTGTLPTGLSLATDYWIIRTSADDVKLASSLAAALAGTALDFTSNGSGTHTFVDTATTARVHWHSYGALPTPIALTVDRGYSVRAYHRGTAAAYSLTGTLSAGNLSASITAVIEK